MSGWSTSELPPWADFWDDELTPRSSAPGLALEQQAGRRATEAGTTSAAAETGTAGCTDANAAAGSGTECWSTSSPSSSCNTLSQDVKAAVEEIDSIVNELWRTALPQNSTLLNNNARLSGAEISNVFSMNPNIDCQIHNLPALSENQKSKSNDFLRVAVVDVVGHSNENAVKHGKPKHKCDKCDKCYIWLTDLVKHKKMHSGERYNCLQCNKTYALKSDLCKHQKVHSHEKSLICKYCGKSFVSTGDMRKHIRIHTGERPYFCKLCNKSFSASDNFHKHLRIHSGDKPLVCSECGQRFLKKSNLQQHSLIHLGEKLFQCEMCGLSFTQKTHLKTHITTHSGLKPYFCSSCDQRFTRNADLKRHVKRVHTDETENRGL